MRATQNEYSKNRELKGEKAKVEDDLKAEIRRLKSLVNQYRTQVTATEAGERRLKEQLVSKETEFEDERRQMREKLIKEKQKCSKLEETTLKAKDEYENKKNSLMKKMIEQDELIHKLSFQINELKVHNRQLETREIESRLKELNKTSIDRSLLEYETNDMNIKSTRGLARSKSPFLNDKTISETVMYGGGTSVIDSIMGSFPQERSSVIISQEFLPTANKNVNLSWVKPSRDASRGDISRRSIKQSALNCKEVGRASTTNLKKDQRPTSRNLNLSKQLDFLNPLADINKRGSKEEGDHIHKTERKEYINTSISASSQAFLPNKFEILEKNKSCSVLSTQENPTTRKAKYVQKYYEQKRNAGKWCYYKII